MIESWGEYYRNLQDTYLFPNEYVVRTFLARYPNLRLPHDYAGARICDISCGDGRNLVLLNKLKLDLYATEVTDEVCRITRQKLLDHSEKISVDIRPGLNWDLPFQNEFFDYLLSWNACYYMQGEGGDIATHIREYARILRPGGHLVCSVPAPGCFSLQGAEDLGNGLIRLKTGSQWAMLTGSIYYRFQDFDDIERIFGECFEDFQRCTIRDDCFGLALEYFVFVCKRRPH